ncbi:MAG: hypothetical protein LBD75_00115 [Candidatus Peribacteria bacterium]|nr:hypothetical protein [Candidatus Peribacteria bacterium]
MEKLNQLKKEFTSLMKYKDLQKPGILLTDLEDKIIVRRWIEYAEGKKMESDKYRSAFVQELNEQVQSSPALQNILNNQVVERKDIRDLEQLLEKSDYRFSTSLLRKVIQSPTADFEQLIRVALGKGNLPGWEQEVQELFEQYIQQKNFSAVQIRFLQIVKSLIIQKKKVDYEMLYSPVFESVFGVGAFERLFKEEEAERLMEFLEGFGLE